MKIKGEMKDLNFFFNLKNYNSKIYLRISLELLQQCGVSLVSDSSFFQLILFLKVYKPLPM